MEFWGREVKPNQSVKVLPDDDHFLHLSQGALGEVKKDDKATVFVEIGDQKLAIGTLSTDKFPQIQFNLVFEKEFELSHNSKTSSVFFSGYKVFQRAEGDEMDSDSEDESEEEEEKIIPALTKENGKPEAKEQKKQVKIDTAAPSKSKAAAKDVGKSKKDDDCDEEVFQPAEGDEMDFDSEEEEEKIIPADFDSEEEEEKIIPAVTKENGKPEANEQKKQVKIDTAAPSKSKAAAKDVGKSKKDDDSDDDDDDSDEDDNSEDDSTDEALFPVEDDSEDESLMCDNDSSDSSGDDVDVEEETPKQETGNKRAAGSVLKTRAADKKAKIAARSGQKTGGKKGAVHVKTPHPAKKADKTPASRKKSLKSGRSVACKSCTKTFDSEIALKLHSKAKHATK